MCFTSYTPSNFTFEIRTVIEDDEPILLEHKSSVWCDKDNRYNLKELSEYEVRKKLEYQEYLDNALHLYFVSFGSLYLWR